MLNCPQATLLIERPAGRPQLVGALMPMRVHLRLCYLCRRYQEQMLLIARVACYQQIPPASRRPCASATRRPHRSHCGLAAYSRFQKPPARIAPRTGAVWFGPLPTRSR